MGNIGFNIEDEFLPSFDMFQSNINKRRMFLKLFNQEVACELKFSNEELKACKYETLFNIFIKKIFKNLRVDSYLHACSFKIDVEKTNQINSFIKRINKENGIYFKSFSLQNNLKYSNIDIAFKLINVFKKSDFSLTLDGNQIFKNFVSNKILRSSSDRKVDINSDSIDIVSDEHLFMTKIFTFWELIDSKDLDIEEHIQQAVNCIETTKFKQIYLVYPKHANFDKHIKIKRNDITCNEYEIKLVPYSLRSTLR